MKVYVIRSGTMYGDDGLVLFAGAYAGGNKGKVPSAINNPDYCPIRNTGPLPPGLYTIGAPHHDPITGEATLSLEPDPSNQMYGRSEFKCHGDNGKGDRSASEGCIVKSPAHIRCQIYNHGENRLRVVAEEADRNPLAAGTENA